MDRIPLEDALGVLDEVCSEEEDCVIDDFSEDDYFEDPNYLPDDPDQNVLDEEQVENRILESIRETVQNDIEDTESTSNRSNGLQTKRNKRGGKTGKKLRKTEEVGPAEIEIDPLILKFPSQTVMGKNGYTWKTDTSQNQSKVPQKNIVHIRSGPVGEAQHKTEPIDCFELFFSEEILNKILRWTNVEIAFRRVKYKVSDDSSLCDTNLVELKALFSLLILSASTKSNNLNSDVLFDKSYSGPRYWCTMSKRRFQFLLTCLRFDDKITREERRKETKFAPISEIFDLFILNCKKWYRPSSYLTVDEQLVGFRGRCPFKMYLPSKPDKYGLKIIAMCDNANAYLVNAIPYLGKGTVPQNQSAGTYFVKYLVEPVKGSYRNITTDNWFTSIPLAESLLKDFKLTTIGTVKRNKPEFPEDFTRASYEKRKINSSLFLFNNDLSAVSYKTKSNKIVVVLSTMHNDAAVNFQTKKPEIILQYNSTKGSVDTLDQMCNNMSCNRKTNRWPMCIFYDLLTIACINSYVIYVHNFFKYAPYNNAKPMSRMKFMMALHDQLSKPWQLIRLEKPTLQRTIKTEIRKLLDLPETQPPEQSNENEANKSRKYCSKCHYKKRRYTTTVCNLCKADICKEHQTPCCKNGCKTN